MNQSAEVRALARWLVRRADHAEVRSRHDDDPRAFDMLVAPLERAGRWLAAHRDGRGRLVLDAEEAKRLVATEQGRALRDELAEDLDLSALFDDAMEDVTLDDARRAWRQVMLQRHAKPKPKPFESEAGVTLPLAAASSAALLLTGPRALIWADWHDVRLLLDGTLLALGIVPASSDGQGAQAVLLVAHASSVGDLDVDGQTLPAQAAAHAFALLHVGASDRWPVVTRHGAELGAWDGDDAIAQLTLRLLQALRDDESAVIADILAALQDAGEAVLAPLWLDMQRAVDIIDGDDDA